MLLSETVSESLHEEKTSAPVEPASKRARVEENPKVDSSLPTLEATTSPSSGATSQKKNWDKMTVAELKAELSKRGLESSGLKAVLVARLKEA